MKTFGKILLLLLLFVTIRVNAQVYNSLPSAAATIYLDFDGHHVEGTSWNMVGPFTCGPANLSSDQILEIFNRVSEDYRPFNVNVTTDSTKYWAAPITKRMRVILTVTSDWYGPAGGVSYMGSFTWGDNTPAFVFTALLNYNTKNIAEATSHEAGHTLGLRHQSSYNNLCVKTNEYNSGAGSGDIGWAPIMGVGYYRNFTLWNNGANPYGCTSFQNDLDIITTSNGFTYRADDYASGTNGSTVVLPFTNNTFQAEGIIETPNDVDAFKFIMPFNGNFKLDVKPYNLGDNATGANLDVEVQLTNKNGTVLNTYNPGSLLYVSIDTTLAAGNYYIKVRGRGNEFAPEYASLGSYTLKSQILTSGGAVLPVRKLELRGTSEKDLHKFNWVIDADEAVVRQTLEVSADGINFQPAILPNTDARQINYRPGQTGTSLYRLKILFANGQQNFSNTVALKYNETPHPEVLGNVIHQQLLVSSPGAYEYTLSDFSGRLMTSGRLTAGQNKVDASRLTTGIYLIRFSNGQDQLTEKFMKQ